MKLLGGRFFFSFFVFLFTLTSFASEGSGESTESKIPSVHDYVFNDLSELETSIAVRKHKGRIYLIIEIDHNFNRNTLTLSAQKSGVFDVDFVQVRSEKRVFGYSNKPVAILPLIEIFGNSSGTVPKNIFPLESGVNRTQQQLDITSYLKGVAEANAIVGGQGRAYSVSELAELSFVIGVQQEGGPRQLKSMNIDMSGLEEGEIRQLHGQKKVSELPIKIAPNTTELLRLSPQMIKRYLSPFLVEIDRGQMNTRTPERYKALVESLPLDMTDAQKQKLVKKLLEAETAEQLLKAVIRQSMSITKTAAARCHNIFTL